MQDPRRPVGPFLCLGPTGVAGPNRQGPGAALSMREEALVRLDIERIMERNAAAG